MSGRTWVRQPASVAICKIVRLTDARRQDRIKYTVSIHWIQTMLIGISAFGVSNVAKYASHPASQPARVAKLWDLLWVDETELKRRRQSLHCTHHLCLKSCLKDVGSMTMQRQNRILCKEITCLASRGSLFSTINPLHPSNANHNRTTSDQNIKRS